MYISVGDTDILGKRKSVDQIGFYKRLGEKTICVKRQDETTSVYEIK